MDNSGNPTEVTGGEVSPVVAGVLTGPRTPGVKVGILVLASDAGLEASEPVVTSKMGERVEVEIAVRMSVPGWMEGEAVSAGTPSEIVGPRSPPLVLVTGVVKDVISAGLGETV